MNEHHLSLSDAPVMETRTKWRPELDKISIRYLKTGAYIAVILNPVFGLVDYMAQETFWQQFMVIRIVTSFLLLIYIHHRSFLRKNPRLTGFLILTTVTLQDAYFFSLATPENINQVALAYLADFVGAGLILLWPVTIAVVYLLTLTLSNMYFFQQFGAMPLPEFLSSGGLLVLAGAVFSMATIVFRYHSVRSLMISKSALMEINDQLAVQNNIIEEKSAELQQSNNRLREFAYIVSHDLKAPLRGIRNLAAWIREDCGNEVGPTAMTHLELMDKQIRKMEQLIKSVLDYSKSGNQKGNLEWIHLDDLIREVIGLVDIEMNTSFKVNSQVPVMMGTRIVISQVLQNLLSNSINHNDKDRREVTINIEDDQSELHFSVADNGPGIHPRDHDKIFQLFQTLNDKPAHDNSGIGLPVARKMIEEAGGRMWVESEPGKGAAFHFTLPRMT